MENTVRFYCFCEHEGCAAKADDMQSCSHCDAYFCALHGAEHRGLCADCLSKVERVERIAATAAKCKFCGSLGVGTPKDSYGYCRTCNNGMDRCND